MDNKKKVFSKRIKEKKRRIKLTLKFIFTNVDFNEGRRQKSPRQSRRAQTACRRARQGAAVGEVVGPCFHEKRGKATADRTMTEELRLSGKERSFVP